MPDRSQIFNQIVKFHYASDFVKMISSLAVGYAMDSDDQQMKKIKEFFYSVDVNPDGCLTLKEMQSSKDKFIDENLAEVEDEPFCSNGLKWKEIFTSIDLDNDGRADFHEFYTAAMDKTELLNQTNIRKIFTTLDHDRNQSLERKDFLRLMPTNLNKTGKVRHTKGPFFETNEKAGTREDIDMVN